MPTSIVAALQIGSLPGGKGDTLEQILGYERAIIESGACLVVMPEALLGGYPKGETFGIQLGYRLPEGREAFARYHADAIDVPGAETDALAQLSARTGASLVLGVIERAGSTLYCTVLFFEPQGGLVTKHRKLMPTGTERLIWGRGDGSTLPVEEREMWQVTMRHIACEGRCFVVTACQVQPSPQALGIEVANWPAERPLINGGSLIVGPMGEVLAGPLVGQAGLLTAQIDTEQLVRARYDFDVTGHYARPDVFELQVDERAKPGVRFIQD